MLNRIRAVRGGALYDARFGARMSGEGIFADQIEALFKVACRKAGLEDKRPALSVSAFRRPPGAQLLLFD